MKKVIKLPEPRKNKIIRNRKGFLFLPKSIRRGDTVITRWFENAEWREEWNYKYPNLAMDRSASLGERSGNWIPTFWLDIEETAIMGLENLGKIETQSDFEMSYLSSDIFGDGDA